MYKKSDWRILSEQWFGSATYIIQNRKNPKDVRRISAIGWEEMENPMTYTREQIVEQLKTTECVVTFTKVNGERREMPCTLQEDRLPQATKDDSLSQKKVREINPEVVSVWCTDKQSWRSFRVENVIEVRAVE